MGLAVDERHPAQRVALGDVDLLGRRDDSQRDWLRAEPNVFDQEGFEVDGLEGADVELSVGEQQVRTFSVGGKSSTTSNVAVPSSSVVTSPECGLTAMPGPIDSLRR